MQGAVKVGTSSMCANCQTKLTYAEEHLDPLEPSIIMLCRLHSKASKFTLRPWRSFDPTLLFAELLFGVCLWRVCQSSSCVPGELWANERAGAEPGE